MTDHPLIGRTCRPLTNVAVSAVICAISPRLPFDHRDSDRFMLLVLLPGGHLETWHSDHVVVE